MIFMMEMSTTDAAKCSEVDHLKGGTLTGLTKLSAIKLSTPL
jgi:hypothetical protein